MSNKSTQFAQNTNIAKQNLRNGKTIDYEKNLAEFRNVISYIDAQLKEGKDNPLIIKTCQNLIRTISGLDLPADVKRHELAVAPSGVQKLYQQMGESKNGNSGSSKLRQEAMHNAIQQSLKDQIANLHNMSKAERMEFYKRIMTAESLQEAINNGFIVNDEYANALLDKAEADLQRLEYLKNQIAELEEKERNGTITQSELQELEQIQVNIQLAQQTVEDNVKVSKTIDYADNNGKTDISSETRHKYTMFYNTANKNDADTPRRRNTVKKIRTGVFEKSPSFPDASSIDTDNNGETNICSETRHKYTMFYNTANENDADTPRRRDTVEKIRTGAFEKSPSLPDASSNNAPEKSNPNVQVHGNKLNAPLDSVASRSVETQGSLADNFSQTYSISTVLADDTEIVNKQIKKDFVILENYQLNNNLDDSINLISNQNNRHGGLKENGQSKIDEKSNFWNMMDTPVVSNYSTNETKTASEQTDTQNDLASNTTAKPNKATEPKKESSLNKTLASNTEQKNDFAPNTTTQTSDITENKNDIFNQSFAPTTDVTSYDVSTNFTLSDSSGQQGSSLTGALSAASYNPYEPMMPSFGNAR